MSVCPTATHDVTAEKMREGVGPQKTPSNRRKKCSKDVWSIKVYNQI